MTDAARGASPLPVSLMHFADSAFPAGGYAHSFGLESYVQAGLVRTPDDVRQFLIAHLEGSAGPCDATAVAAALRAADRADLPACRAVDDTLDAMKPVRGFRDASRQMGRQTLRVASALTGHAALGAYSADVEADRAPGHHAVALGMAGAVFGWSAVDTATAFLYGATALLVGAALRLLPMGQVEGQRLLFAMHGPIARLAHEAAARPADAMWSFAPGLDIQGCRHAALGARLFRS